MEAIVKWHSGEFSNNYLCKLPIVRHIQLRENSKLAILAVLKSKMLSLQEQRLMSPDPLVHLGVGLGKKP